MSHRSTRGVIAGPLFRVPEHKLLIIGLQLIYPFVVSVKFSANTIPLDVKDVSWEICSDNCAPRCRNVKCIVAL